jgi:hypothetical protein
MVASCTLYHQLYVYLHIYIDIEAIILMIDLSGLVLLYMLRTYVSLPLCMVGVHGLLNGVFNFVLLASSSMIYHYFTHWKASSSMHDPIGRCLVDDGAPTLH